MSLVYEEILKRIVTQPAENGHSFAKIKEHNKMLFIASKEIVEMQAKAFRDAKKETDTLNNCCNAENLENTNFYRESNKMRGAENE